MHRRHGRGRPGGFTLMELLMALSITVLVAAAAVTLFLVNLNTFHLLALTTNSSKGASHLLEQMVYNFDGGTSLRAASTEDILVEEEEQGDGWRVNLGLDDAGVARHVAYDPDAGEITDQFGRVLVHDVTAADVTWTNQGLRMEVTVEKAGFRKRASTTMTSFVRCRN